VSKIGTMMKRMESDGKLLNKQQTELRHVMMSFDQHDKAIRCLFSFLQRCALWVVTPRNPRAVCARSVGCAGKSRAESFQRTRITKRPNLQEAGS